MADGQQVNQTSVVVGEEALDDEYGIPSESFDRSNIAQIEYHLFTLH